MSYCRVDARGRVLQQSTTLSGLGFSLKPPKWLRKAQPGKILKKAAIPLAVIGGALLIPGVGGALVGAATAAGRAAAGAGRLIGRGAVGAGRGIFGAGKGVIRTVPKLIQAPSSAPRPVSFPAEFAPTPFAPVSPQESMQPVSLAPAAAMQAVSPSESEAAPTASTPDQSGLLIGAVAVGALLLFASSRRR
ncbi:MAG TPA: hypothetical protein VJL31_12935 [Gemmatimonadales bacterium]|nr:hypothetical protein [Gemmatimonadales bacterium]